MSIPFNSKTSEYAWLSNFSEHAFTLDGIVWKSVEHYYQAQKFLGTETADLIRQAETPLKARKTAQNRSLAPRADWDSVKMKVMRDAIFAKFQQNSQLKARLLSSDEEPLIHESSSDFVWGQSKDGVGQNQLGVVLMEMRELLRSEILPRKNVDKCS